MGSTRTRHTLSSSYHFAFFSPLQIVITMNNIKRTINVMINHVTQNFIFPAHVIYLSPFFMMIFVTRAFTDPTVTVGLSVISFCPKSSASSGGSGTVASILCSGNSATAAISFSSRSSFMAVFSVFSFSYSIRSANRPGLSSNNAAIGLMSGSVSIPPIISEINAGFFFDTVFMISASALV